VRRPTAGRAIRNCLFGIVWSIALSILGAVLLVTLIVAAFDSDTDTRHSDSNRGGSPTSTSAEAGD
jgi:hypothetical protein